jgi:hypothetical protein
MKKLIIQFVVFTILFSPCKKLYSQDEGTVAAIAAIGLAAGTIAAVDQMEEQLELYATNYILSTYPNLKGFSVKLLNYDASTYKDLSMINCVIFGFSEYDINNGDKMKNEIFIIFNSYGWENQFGNDYDKNVYVKMDRDQWNSLIKKYYSIASPFGLNDDNSMPIFEYVGSDLKSSNIPDIKKLKNPKSKTYFDYYRKTIDTFNFRKQYQLKNDGLWVDIRKKGKFGFPFYSKVNGDTYFLDEFDENFKIVFNENRLGFFLNKTKELIQIRKNVVKKVTDFLN